MLLNLCLSGSSFPNWLLLRGTNKMVGVARLELADLSHPKRALYQTELHPDVGNFIITCWIMQVNLIIEIQLSGMSEVSNLVMSKSSLSIYGRRSQS